MSVSLGLLPDYEYVTKQNYTGIHILPLFFIVVVHAQEYVQKPVASLKIMSWNIFQDFMVFPIFKASL